VVQRVIVKTIEGRRKWDPAKGPLVPWLKDQIKSEIDALAKSAPHRYDMPLDEEGGEHLRDKSEHHATEVDILGDMRSLDPETILLEKEKTNHARERVDALFEAVSGEAELEEVLEAVLNGCEPKPRYVAEALGTSVNDINNRLRRLRRRAIAISKEAENEQAKTP